MRAFVASLALVAAGGAGAWAKNAELLFHQAPASARGLKNPYRAGDPAATGAGQAIFAARCARCHGTEATGGGNIPSLRNGDAQTASAGELFWFLDKGAPENGMPPSGLPDAERWQVVTYLRTLPQKPVGKLAPVASPRTTAASAPPPTAPFTDYRFEKPGQAHHIHVEDLPPPSPESASVDNDASLVPRPADAWPKVPAGFKVQLYAEGLDNPRLMRTAPNGDVFLAESETGKIRVFRGLTAAGHAARSEVFATGLTRPYGIAFYPRGPDPKWVYVGDVDAVMRFAYRKGDLHARAPAQKVIGLPHESHGHWTRDIQFSLDGKRMFVGVGSASNIDDPDLSPQEKDRSDILEFRPDGSGQRVYAYGIRNAGGGLAIQPATGALWCSANERDALGDNLVPDYITRVKEGGFYGWPWWYMGGHQDPRHAGKHPELRAKVITPDVLIQPHHASLQLAFYDGAQFPAEYRGDIFAAQHGSWNRSVRTGYELIRVPLHQAADARGGYEDFMTGFVTDDGRVWGRPVGVTVAADGALLVSDDGSRSVWRVSRAAGGR